MRDNQNPRSILHSTRIDTDSIVKNYVEKPELNFINLVP
jgi:hypothetical protein